MGGVCSRGFPEEPPPRSVADAHVARRARYGPGDFDSGELAIPPPKPHPSHKVLPYVYTLGFIAPYTWIAQALPLPSHACPLLSLSILLPAAGFTVHLAPAIHLRHCCKILSASRGREEHDVTPGLCLRSALICWLTSSSVRVLTQPTN